MIPLFLTRRAHFSRPRRSFVCGLALVSLAIAVDLACSNVALSTLSVALFSTIKATSPAATLLVERIYHRTQQHPVIWLTVLTLCLGPVLTRMGSRNLEASTFGVLMTIAAVLGGACKYVLAHDIIANSREELGLLGFTFWVEVFVLVPLAPWALASGEAASLLAMTFTLREWLLLWVAAAFGGVRVLAQFYVLAHVTATSLAMSNVAIQVGQPPHASSCLPIHPHASPCLLIPPHASSHLSMPPHPGAHDRPGHCHLWYPTDPAADCGRGDDSGDGRGVRVA